ncbi:MAG: hypothetical protein HS116_15330 [Planctomycetes bacterium]|nr:hypothetical protein [Planctomycetota bacterium]
MDFSKGYSSDFICKNLGLGCFDNTEEARIARFYVRMLFKPSWHPESCVTISTQNDQTILRYAYFEGESLWHSKGIRTPLAFTEQHILPSSPIDGLLSITAEASSHAVDVSRGVTLDGMGCCFLWKHHSQVMQNETNVGSPGFWRDWACAVLQVCWDAVQNPHAKQVVAATASYVGLEFNPATLPPVKPRTHVLLLGAEEERQNLLDSIHKAFAKDGDKPS